MVTDNGGVGGPSTDLSLAAFSAHRGCVSESFCPLMATMQKNTKGVFGSEHRTKA